MRQRHHSYPYLVLLLLLLAILACNIPGVEGEAEKPTKESPLAAPTETSIPTKPPKPTPSDTSPPPMPTLTPTEDSTTVTPCMLTANSEVNAYTRPSLEAEVFAVMPVEMPFYVEAYTADGWIGFDPAYAQAANIGVFHHRWVQESSELTLEGDCADIPIVVGPPPGVCFTMPMGDVPIYVDPDTSTSVLITLHIYDYVKVEGKTADNWFEVDLGVGNVEMEGNGWMEGLHVNFNGPCMDLPIVSP